MNELYHQKKLIAIVGPTATGKSELAIELAKKIGGEIISADSRAIYKNLSIGTAKVRGKWIKRKIDGRRPYNAFVYRGVTHHMVDFRSPKLAYSAAAFARSAREKIKSIRRRGSVPIICGGTGFWIDALLQPDMTAAAAPNQKLRSKLKNKSASELFLRLKKIDPKRAEVIDKKNPRRLIRAIEVAGGRHSGDRGKNDFQNYSVIYLGLTLPNEELKKRIKTRFHKWLGSGLLAETRGLVKTVSKKRLGEIGLQYPIVAEYLNKKITRSEMTERSVNSIYHYGKRQKTWFRRNPNIHWIRRPKEALKLARQYGFFR